jgi:hypothetical protein
MLTDEFYETIAANAKAKFIEWCGGEAKSLEAAIRDLKALARTIHRLQLRSQAQERAREVGRVDGGLGTVTPGYALEKAGEGSGGRMAASVRGRGRPVAR